MPASGINFISLLNEVYARGAPYSYRACSLCPVRVYIHNEIMPVQILITKYLPQEENVWLTSLTDSLKGAQLERVILEREKISVEIGALIYAIAVANPDVLKEESDKMGQTLEAVLDEIGYVDKRVLETERKEASERMTKLAAEASEKIAKLAMEAEMAKMDKEQFKKEKARAEAEKARIEAENNRIEAEKARIEAEKNRIEAEKAQAEAETTDIKKNFLEAAFYMLNRGTPPALVSKWTGLPEDDILRLKAEMDITSVSKISTEQ